MEWNKAALIFDTSAIIDCYWYSTEVITFIHEEIFSKFKNRIFLPDQVSIEYERHREAKKSKPADRYLELKKEGKNKDGGYLSKITTEIKTINGLINTLIEETKTVDKHPWLSVTITEPLKQITNKYSVDIKSILSSIEGEIDFRVKQIHEAEDLVFKGLNDHFTATRKYNFTEKFEIAKEGQQRYNMDFPPGYEDAKGKDAKVGLNKFGDLFLWKQIIEIAKEQNVPVILVINDLKIDWCTKEVDNPKRIEKPRQELIEEFLEFTGNQIIMFSLSQFLYYSQEKLDIKLPNSQPLRSFNEIFKRLDLVATNRNSDFWGISHDINGVCIVSKTEIKIIFHSFLLTNRNDTNCYIKEISMCASKNTLNGWATIRKSLPYQVDFELGPNATHEINGFSISLSREDLEDLNGHWITFEVKSKSELKGTYGTTYTHWHELEEVEEK